MRIHLIAIGGSVMHNLALALHCNHHTVSGSDDEIYNPAKEKLAQKGLLPEKTGWDANRITSDLDAVILGMHARKDNPELTRALELGLRVYSFPEFIFEQSKNKTRVVVTGSHGKTTTTAMIMQVLSFAGLAFDYLVGAQLEGFDTMVQLSEAPLIVIEGDEYLSSALDRRPKFLHYHPQVAVLTGIAWDHINVFPTFENYLFQFEQLLRHITEGGTLIYYKKDENIRQILKKSDANIVAQSYEAFPTSRTKGVTFLKRKGRSDVPLKIFGEHNMANLKAAYLACRKIGISEEIFFDAIQHFKGALKRLQLLVSTPSSAAWTDFAHAPSKVAATIQAVKTQFPERQLIACLELHTFSSLNKHFFSQYAHTMDPADQAVVFFSEHALQMKKLPPISGADIQSAFVHPHLKVFTKKEALENWLKKEAWQNKNLLLMSSGTFENLDVKTTVKSLFQP